ncbi:L,D-transpeptidase [Roseateles sp. P5_E4]
MCGIATVWSLFATASAGAQVISRPVASDARDGRPFAIVDKRQATLSIYAADGSLVGRAPVLLGLTPGDQEPQSSRGKQPAALKVNERVTPAGRFEAQPGVNLNGERIVWFDYGANLAIHRLRPAPASQRRPERLASARLEDRRITLGCVVVEPAFFDEVVLPTLGAGKSLVYILPEREPVLAAAAGAPHAAAP